MACDRHLGLSNRSTDRPSNRWKWSTDILDRHDLYLRCDCASRLMTLRWPPWDIFPNYFLMKQGTPDCPDARDEWSSLCSQTCKLGYEEFKGFSCKRAWRRCLSFNRFCDEELDCMDSDLEARSDEKDCQCYYNQVSNSKLKITKQLRSQEQKKCAFYSYTATRCMTS